MPFVSDTFTDTAGTTLASHTGETGATWAENTAANAGEAVITDANRLRSNHASNSNYYASGVPATAEYDVAADFHFKATTGDDLGIWGRLATTAVDGYLLYRSASAWHLYVVQANVYTELGSYTQSVSIDTSYVGKLEIRAAAKKVYIDGVERISSANNAVTAAGRAGIYSESVATNANRVHLDNFTATDVAVAAGVPFLRRPERGLILR